jgi:hypothetical protein
MRWRHNRNEDGAIQLRMQATKSLCDKPYNVAMASNGVRSSHAISMIRDWSALENSGIFFMSLGFINVRYSVATHLFSYERSH